MGCKAEPCCSVRIHYLALLQLLSPQTLHWSTSHNKHIHLTVIIQSRNTDCPLLCYHTINGTDKKLCKYCLVSKGILWYQSDPGALKRTQVLDRFSWFLTFFIQIHRNVYWEVCTVNRTNTFALSFFVYNSEYTFILP